MTVCIGTICEGRLGFIMAADHIHAVRRPAILAFAYLLAALTVCATSTPASATPFVDIRADWNVGVDPVFSPVIPNGITISCFGGAIGGAVFAAPSCSDSRSLVTTVTTSEHLSVGALSGLVLTNTSDQTFNSFLSFRTDFSAFNPGGPGVGISIDDPITQAASFTSSVFGQGPFFLGVFDFHSCSVGFAGYSGHVFSSTTCGVQGPDSSEEQFGINLATLGPGQSEQLPYTINITADFTVPEPSSLSILAIGLLGLGAVGRRKRDARLLNAKAA